MGYFEDIQNPWSPGGQMSPWLPWAQPGLNYGWGHGNEFFHPKTKEQIQEEALMQLAVLAVVLVAPALVGAGGGAGAGGSLGSGAGTAGGSLGSGGGIGGSVGAGMGTSAEAAGGILTQAEAVSGFVDTTLSAAPLVPAAGAGSGAAAASGGGGALAGVLGVAQVLMPFLQGDSRRVLQKAAAMGEEELNRGLHQLSRPGTQRVELLEEGLGRLGGSPVDRMTPRRLGMRQDLPFHESVPMLVELKEEIRRRPRLQAELRKVMRENCCAPVLTVQATGEVRSVMNRQIGGPLNPWEYSNSPTPMAELPRKVNLIEHGEKLTFEDGEMEAWFWNVYFPAMSKEDKDTILKLSNSCTTRYHVSFNDLPAKGEEGGTIFNFDLNRIDLLISKKYLDYLDSKGKVDYSQTVAILGDEFQHCLQFETGEMAYIETTISTGKKEAIPVGYDVADEIESQDGGLRATEAYIRNVILKDEKSRGEFLTTKEGRVNGYLLLNPNQDNPSTGLSFQYMKEVRNPFPTTVRQLTPKEFLLKYRYSAAYFKLGEFKEGVKSTLAYTTSNDSEKYPMLVLNKVDKFILGRRMPETSDRIVTGIVWVRSPSDCTRILELQR